MSLLQAPWAQRLKERVLVRDPTTWPQIRKNILTLSPTQGENILISTRLSSAFFWTNTEQGDPYWRNLNNRYFQI